MANPRGEMGGLAGEPIHSSQRVKYNVVHPLHGSVVFYLAQETDVPEKPAREWLFGLAISDAEKDEIIRVSTI